LFIQKRVAHSQPGSGETVHHHHGDSAPVALYGLFDLFLVTLVYSYFSNHHVIHLLCHVCGVDAMRVAEMENNIVQLALGTPAAIAAGLGALYLRCLSYIKKIQENFLAEASQVGRRSLTVSKSVLKAPLVSVLETKI
jgi:hypothetical protein